MSVQELETEISRLSKPELRAFAQWFEEFVAGSWNQQIEADFAAGKLDHLGKKADAQFEAGRTSPHSVLDIVPVSLGQVIRPLGSDDDLLDELLEDRH